MEKSICNALLLCVMACGGSADVSSDNQEAGSGNSSGGEDGNTFQLSDSRPSAQDDHPSNIVPTTTEAAVKFVVVDKDKGPVEGIVIALTAPDGRKLYTDETDETGYTEILVPVGVKYELVYLSLGRDDIAAQVDVPNEPKLNLSLTLRYKRWVPEVQPKATPLTRKPTNPPPPEATRFVIDGVEFDTGKATLRPESKAKLARVVEYMTHKKSARIEISGHTDNVGKPKANLALSQKRAESVRDYLVAEGIEESRIEAVGYGDTMPLAPNDSDEGRQRNRRIEATEL